MDEEGEEHGAEPEPERGVATAHRLEQPGRPDEQPHVQGQADDAQLGRDGERGGVGDEVGLGRALRAAARLARGCPPLPTPTSGCFAKTLAVSFTRATRSLEARFSDSPWPTLTTTNAAPAITAMTPTAATTRRTAASPVTAAIASVTTSSAAMLDWE